MKSILLIFFFGGTQQQHIPFVFNGLEFLFCRLDAEIGRRRFPPSQFCFFLKGNIVSILCKNDENKKSNAKLKQRRTC